jgi:PEP-CTERM motif
VKKVLKTTLLCTGLILGASRVEAVPMLQLDIIGGYYDAATQTIVSNGPTFTLVALLTPGPEWDTATALLDTYYLSAALTPQMGPTHSSIGSFTYDPTWDGLPATSVDVTSDMTYGTPPLEGGDASHDGGDLGGHSVYPTFFSEFAFNFSSLQRAEGYNTALSPGGLVPTSDYSGTFYRTFDFALSFPSNYQLHFDLYDTYLRSQCTGPNRLSTCNLDEDIDHFAPFSHDASSGVIPEPASLLLLATGLAFSAKRLRKRPGQRA